MHTRVFMALGIDPRTAPQVKADRRMPNLIVVEDDRSCAWSGSCSTAGEPANASPPMRIFLPTRSPISRAIAAPRGSARPTVPGRSADGRDPGGDARQACRRVRLIVESPSVGAEEIAAAPSSRPCRNTASICVISTRSPGAKGGVNVLTMRRRANIACAELAITLMLMLARRGNDWPAASASKRSRL